MFLAIGANGLWLRFAREFRPAFQSDVEKLKINKKCQKTAKTRIKCEPMLAAGILSGLFDSR